MLIFLRKQTSTEITMYEIDYKNPCRIYFVGIGGVSMSGLARILADAGFEVSGSDRQASALTDELTQLGLAVHIGQAASNIPEDIDVAVYTAAIHDDNPEYAELVRRDIPMLTRAQLLGQVMSHYKRSIAVSGTHGKTTTTCMLAESMLAAKLNPTLTIGGTLPSINSNVRVGGRDCILAEACEYTNSFLELTPNIGVILNIDADHLDFFHDISEIRVSFRKFAERIPAKGILLISSEIPDLAELIAGLRCKVYTFGRDSLADYAALDITQPEDGMARCSFSFVKIGSQPVPVTLSVPGRHNVINAVAALAVSDILGIPASVSVPAIQSFGGALRRFEIKGHIGSPDSPDSITVIDDYAHHPTEVRATLKTAKKYPHTGRIWCVFQPHTYSRTKALLREFSTALALADAVVLAPVYSARETDSYGVNSHTLYELLRNNGKEAYCLSDFDSIELFLLQHCSTGDLLITMGAGDIYRVAEDLLGL